MGRYGGRRIPSRGMGQKGLFSARQKPYVGRQARATQPHGTAWTVVHTIVRVCHAVETGGRRSHHRPSCRVCGVCACCTG